MNASKNRYVFKSHLGATGDETLVRVGQMAEAMDRPRAWLMAEAIKQYVAREEWFQNQSA